MDSIVGESGRYLEVDLGERSFRVFSPPKQDLDDYLGGSGLGLKLYHDRLGARLASVDPLGPENILAFLTGCFAGTGAPCSARFAGVTKSPLTGIMVTSSCGGPFGLALRTAGWDGLLVKGAAEGPVILHIDEKGADFREAAELWGFETGPAQAKLGLGPKDGSLVIGPAGENLVPYAVIRSGARFLGRGGMGAVMGAKRLKAIVATGRAYKILPADPARFERIQDRARRYIERSGISQSYRAYGTNYGVDPGVDAGYAPVHNFRDRSDERCRDLSGEAMARRYSTTHAVCSPCAIRCGHKGSYPDGKVRHIPEYETVGIWGGNIMNFDPDLVGIWNERMGELGLDTISCGVTVGWAMEAAERGLRPSTLAFGRTENIPAMIEDIAWRRGEGAELAEGSRRLAEKYGGLDFAAQVKGLEMAAYDPRAAWGQGLNYAVANRGGCHLNAYPIALEVLFGFLPRYSTRSKAAWVDFLEDFFSAVNSTQTCQFSTFAYLLEPIVARLTPKPILRLVMTRAPGLARLALDWSCLSGLVAAITGRKVTQRSFLQAGRRAHILERSMNCLMGISAADDTLPSRFLEEARTQYPDESVVDLAPMLRSYYRVKGYGPDGLPTARTLRALRIPVVLPASEGLVPRGRPVATLYARVALGLLGRAFAVASRLDAGIQSEVKDLPNGFRFALTVHPGGPSATLEVEASPGSGGKPGATTRLRYLGSGKPVKAARAATTTGGQDAAGSPSQDRAAGQVRGSAAILKKPIPGRRAPLAVDLLMRFEGMGPALQVLTFSASAFEVYASNGLAILGNLSTTMAIMRALGIVESLLLPHAIASRVLKRVPPMPFWNKIAERIALYLALPFVGVSRRP